MTTSRYKLRVEKCAKITGFSKEQIELLIERGFKPETDDLSQVRFWVAAQVPGTFDAWRIK